MQSERAEALSRRNLKLVMSWLHLHVDVRASGAKGVRDDSLRPWTLVLNYCWPHFELKDEKKKIVVMKN